MTFRESILCALSRACGGDLATRFTLSELVVLAWRFDPRFALAGHPQYPDSNRVKAEICRMVQRWRRQGRCRVPVLERVGVNLYRLTQAGLDVAAKIGEAKGAA